MFIQTSTTPNPASLMFIPGEKVMEVCIRSANRTSLTLLPSHKGAGTMLEWTAQPMKLCILCAC